MTRDELTGLIKSLRQLAPSVTHGPWRTSLSDDTLVETVQGSRPVATTTIEDRDYGTHYAQMEADAKWLTLTSPDKIMAILNERDEMIERQDTYVELFKQVNLTLTDIRQMIANTKDSIP